MGIQNKWPGLIITGNSVTKEQAAEIMIRTGSFYFSSNDRDFEKDLNFLLFGIACPTFDISNKENLGSEYWNRVELLNKQYKVLDLHYLQNHRVLSAWVGGPHGWCDWEGNIKCSNYNIGKWPSDEEVKEELTLIAEAFPFLDMTVQLLNQEIGEDAVNEKVVLQFKIKDGVCNEEPSGDLLISAKFEWQPNLLAYGRERGCTLDQFAQALETVETKHKTP